YLVFFLQSVFGQDPSSSFGVTFTAIEDFFNVCSPAALLLCYFELSEKTVNTDASPRSWVFPVIAIGVLEMLLIIAFSLNPQLTPGRGLIIAISAVIVGISGGIVLGLLVGQL